MKQILLFVLLVKGFVMYAQCAVAFQEFPENGVKYLKSPLMLVMSKGDVKKPPLFSLARIDTVNSKDKPLYYFTISTDSTTIAYYPDRLTLWFRDNEKVTLESVKVIISEFVVIFQRGEIFVKTDSSIFNRILNNQLVRVTLKDKTSAKTYDIDSNYIKRQLHCLKGLR